MGLFQQISLEENVTIVMVTHDLIIEEYASLVYHLNDGQFQAVVEHPENR
jgi:ABC-type lipoprotein export system ATPase subunit